MSVKIPALLSSAAITALTNKAIASVGASFSQVHEAAFQCLAHAHEHGDTGPMQRLLNGLGKHAMSRPVMIWAATFGPFQKKDGEASAGTLTLKLKDGRKPADWKLEEGYRTQFWTMIANRNNDDKAIEITDVRKRLESVLKWFRNVEEGEVANRHLGNSVGDPKATEAALEAAIATFDSKTAPVSLAAERAKREKAEGDTSSVAKPKAATKRSRKAA